MSRLTLRLYVAHPDSHDRRTVGEVERFCATHLEGRYDLTVVDVADRPELAEREGILATPTLVCESNRAALRVVGTLGDDRRLLYGLGLEQE